MKIQALNAKREKSCVKVTNSLFIEYLSGSRGTFVSFRIDSEQSMQQTLIGMP
jgi:hypothetical protein